MTIEKFSYNVYKDEEFIMNGSCLECAKYLDMTRNSFFALVRRTKLYEEQEKVLDGYRAYRLELETEDELPKFMQGTGENEIKKLASMVAGVEASLYDYLIQIGLSQVAINRIAEKVAHIQKYSAMVGMEKQKDASLQSVRDYLKRKETYGC